MLTLRGACAQVLPLCMAASFFLLLPPLSALAPKKPFADNSSSSPYAPLRRGDSDLDDDEDHDEAEEGVPDEVLLERADAALPSLTTREKIELARPLVRRYMLPLFLVYLAGASRVSLFPSARAIASLEACVSS